MLCVFLNFIYCFCPPSSGGLHLFASLPSGRAILSVCGVRPSWTALYAAVLSCMSLIGSLSDSVIFKARRLRPRRRPDAESGVHGLRVAGRSRLRPRPPPSGRTAARRSQAACQHIARPPRVLVTLPGLPWPLCHPLAAVVLLKIPRGPRGPWRPRRPLGPAPLLGSRGQPAPAAPRGVLAALFHCHPPSPWMAWGPATVNILQDLFRFILHTWVLTWHLDRMLSEKHQLYRAFRVYRL